MALETLKGVKEIGGFKVVDMDAIRSERPDMFRPDGSMHYHIFEKEIRPHHFIYVRNDVNSISFTMQKGPIKEVGVNGVQVDTLIETAARIIESFNSKIPCEENGFALSHLKCALMMLDARKRNREAKGVEGTSKQIPQSNGDEA